MIVAHNPIFLFEAATAGGISFTATKFFPKYTKTADTILFLALLASIDLMYRYFLVRDNQNPAPKADILITQEKPKEWGWIVSPRGGHLLFVPGWAIGVIGSVFNIVL